MKNDLNKQLNSYIKNFAKLLNKYKSELPNHIADGIKYLIKNDIEKNMGATHGRYNGIGTGLFDGGSEHWVELAPKTIKNYEYLGYKGDWLRPTLERSGDLIHSINVNYRNNLTFEIIANTPYAEIHQKGGGNIPARPYIVIQDSTKKQIENLIEEGFNEYIKTHQKELYS